MNNYIKESFEDSFNDNEVDYTDVMNNNDNEALKSEIKKWLFQWVHEINNPESRPYHRHLSAEDFYKNCFIIRDNLDIDVNTSISLRVPDEYWQDNTHFEIPNYIQFNKVDGDFSCRGLGLTTLKGCPRIVTKTMGCSDNDLISLKYAPEECDMFICDFNECLTDFDDIIKYAPKKCRTFGCHQYTFTKEQDQELLNKLIRKYNFNSNIFLKGRNKFTVSVNESFADSFDDDENDFIDVAINNDNESLINKIAQWIWNHDYYSSSIEKIKNAITLVNIDGVNKINYNTSIAFKYSDEEDDDEDEYNDFNDYIPDYIKFNIVSGDFTCSGLNMEDIGDWCPVEVKSFDCHDNDIRYISNFPSIIHDTLDISDNNVSMQGGWSRRYVLPHEAPKFTQESEEWGFTGIIWAHHMTGQWDRDGETMEQFIKEICFANNGYTIIVGDIIFSFKENPFHISKEQRQHIIYDPRRNYNWYMEWCLDDRKNMDDVKEWMAAMDFETEEEAYDYLHDIFESKFDGFKQNRQISESFDDSFNDDENDYADAMANDDHQKMKEHIYKVINDWYDNSFTDGTYLLSGEWNPYWNLYDYSGKDPDRQRSSADTNMLISKYSTNDYFMEHDEDDDYLHYYKITLFNNINLYLPEITIHIEPDEKCKDNAIPYRIIWWSGPSTGTTMNWWRLGESENIPGTITKVDINENPILEKDGEMMLKKDPDYAFYVQCIKDSIKKSLINKYVGVIESLSFEIS